MKPLYWLLLSRFTGGLGYQIFVLSGLFSVYQKTQSAAATGMTGLVLFLPAMFLNLFFGQWADKIKNKAAVYFILQAAVVPLSLGMLVPIVRSNTFGILMLLAVYSLLRGLRTPLYYSLMNASSASNKAPVSKGRLSQLSTIAWQGPLIAGPFLFSFMHDFTKGASVTFIFVILFAIAALASAPLIRAVKTDQVSKQKVSGQTWLQLFKENPIWIRASVLDAVVMGSLSFVSLIPFLLKGIQEDPSKVGYLRSMISLGACACICLFEVQAFQNRREQIFVGALAIGSLAVFLLPVSGSFSFLICLSFIFGFCDGFSILYRDYLVFMAPKDATGRVSSLSQILNSVSEDLGEFRAGMMGDFFGASQALYVSAIIGGGATALFWARTLSSSSGNNANRIAESTLPCPRSLS
ncbi:MAG: MFS transporter [Proteobacteria bacterium]|nr:MAG: MFS transporter [Pseudomonadota bacterium]